jgi:hypothetical protein
MRSFRLAFRTFLACASFTILPLTAIADQPASTAPPLEQPASASPPPEHPAQLQATQEAVVVSPTDNPQVLQFKNNKVELTLPKGYSIKKFAPAGNTEYAFSGPKNPDGTGPGVMTLVIDLQATDERPADKVVLEMMMKPGKANLNDFQQKDNAAVEINGRSFENADYSGSLPDGKSLKGFFYVGRLKNGFLVFAGRDGGDHFKDSAETLRGIVNSCKVQGE